MTHWHEWTQAFWTAAFSWIGIHIHRFFTPLLSFTVFLAMVVTGTILRTANPTLPDSSSKVTRSKTQLLKSIAGRFGIYVIGSVAALGAATVVSSYRLGSVYTVSVLPAFMLATFAVIIWASKERLQSLALVTLLTLFWVALAILPLLFIGPVTLDSEKFSHGLAIFLTFTLVPIGVIAIDIIAPVKSINRRLLFLAIGTLSLVALNMISVLGLKHLIEAPKPPL